MTRDESLAQQLRALTDEVMAAGDTFNAVCQHAHDSGAPEHAKLYAKVSKELWKAVEYTNRAAELMDPSPKL